MNNNSRTAKRYVLYARKSTESEDKQIQSIDDQIKVMQDIAKNKNLNIVETLSEAKSAKKPDVRPEFIGMIEGFKSGKYDGVLAWDLSRLSRNPQDNGLLQQMLDDGVIKLIRTSQRTYIDEDDLVFTLESTMNSRFIKELKVKVKRGMDSKADKGDFPGVPPIGYLNDREKHIIIKDPETWLKVRAMWDKMLTGTYTIAELTRIGDEELRLKTHQRKRSGGKSLCHNGVRKMFTNPFYVGNFLWDSRIYKGNHPAMVTIKEFDQVQKLLSPTHST